MRFPPPNRNLTYFCFLAVVGFGLFVNQGFAAGEPELATGFLDDLTKQFQERASIWEGHFRTAAINVFRTLLLLDFIYISFDILFLKGEDLRSWAGEILRQFLIGFFGAARNNPVARSAMDLSPFSSHEAFTDCGKFLYAAK
ncbi:hypothetical protein [Cephaloticoccus primus]|uniref:hypothetical protein n=1 Tax=Cephaloticoccus primus TaxID=1548207 RepID=UPI0012E783B9|nr:hypothetical protein [Cephaloticoccus primus]